MSDKITIKPGQRAEVRVPDMEGATHFAVNWECERCGGQWRRVFPRAVTQVEIWCPTCDPEQEP